MKTQISSYFLVRLAAAKWFRPACLYRIFNDMLKIYGMLMEDKIFQQRYCGINCNKKNTDFVKMGLSVPGALPHLKMHLVKDGCVGYLTIVNSTLLFLARPSLVSLLATGLVNP